MKFNIKQLVNSIIISLIMTILVYIIFQSNISRLNLTPFLIVVLIFFFFGLFFFLIILSYYSGLTYRTERVLQKYEKWDSPKRVALTLIIVWISLCIYCYIFDYWIFLIFGISFTIVHIYGVYKRNLYRKELEMEMKNSF